jgi:hypothetical protein
MSAYLLTFMSYITSNTLVSISQTAVQSWIVIDGEASALFVESFWHFMTMIHVQSMIQQISYIAVVMPIYITIRSYIAFQVQIQTTPVVLNASASFLIGGVTGGIIVVAFVAGVMLFIRKRANPLGASDEIPEFIEGESRLGFQWTNQKEKDEFSSYSWSYSYSCSDFYSDEDDPVSLGQLVVNVEGPGLQAINQGSSSQRESQLRTRGTANRK